MDLVRSLYPRTSLFFFVVVRRSLTYNHRCFYIFHSIFIYYSLTGQQPTLLSQPTFPYDLIPSIAMSMEASPVGVFVYGSLRHDAEAARYTKEFNEGCVSLEAELSGGRLFCETPTYPSLVLTTTDTATETTDVVKGMLVLPASLDATLALADRIEREGELFQRYV